MKKLLKELAGYEKEVVLAPLFKMLEALFELFVPLVMKNIIDEAIPAGDTGRILESAGILFGLALVGLACSLTAQYFAAKAATGFSARIREKCFDHIQRLSFTSLDKIGTPTLLTRMTSDISQLQNGVNLTLRLFMRSPFVVFGAMIMAFIVSPEIAWVFVGVIVVLSVVVFGIMLLTMPLYKGVQGALDGVSGRTRENLTGVRVIRAFRLEKQETEQFTEEHGILTHLRHFAGKISAAMNPLTYIFVNFGILFVLYLGAVRVDAFGLSQGAVIALVNYLGQILVELVKLANLIIQMTRAAASGNRVEELLETGAEEMNPGKAGMLTENTAEIFEPGTQVESVAEIEVKSSAPGDTPLLRFSNVSMQYDGASEPAIQDITFEVHAGETIGIIGGTGSGKTTLVSLIPAFYPVSSGKLLLLGKDIADYDRKSLRKAVGIVMQHAVLFSGTVRENLLWGNPNASDDDLSDALRKAQALSFVTEKGGLSAEVEQDGRNFSGGEKQRLSIARALVRNPEILILDDSSSALDFATDAALRSEIGKMDPGMTVFIVSQRAASVMNADRIIVLEDGKIAGIGSHEPLLKECAVYREIYESQFR